MPTAKKIKDQVTGPPVRRSSMGCGEDRRSIQCADSLEAIPSSLWRLPVIAGNVCAGRCRCFWVAAEWAVHAEAARCPKKTKVGSDFAGGGSWAWLDQALGTYF